MNNPACLAHQLARHRLPLQAVSRLSVRIPRNLTHGFGWVEMLAFSSESEIVIFFHGRYTELSHYDLQDRSFEAKKTANRGLARADTAATRAQVVLMHEYVSQYVPNMLYRDITQRATSLTAVSTGIGLASRPPVTS